MKVKKAVIVFHLYRCVSAELLSNDISVKYFSFLFLDKKPSFSSFSGYPDFGGLKL